MENSNRYFFKNHKFERIYGSFLFKSFAFMLGIYLFLAAFLAFSWFLFMPLLRTESISITNSPLFYLALLWGASNFIAFYYAFQEYSYASRRAYEAQRQKEELGDFLSNLETILQERMEQHKSPMLPQLASNNYNYEKSSDVDSEISPKRKVILWELYDSFLNEINAKRGSKN